MRSPSSLLIHKFVLWAANTQLLVQHPTLTEFGSEHELLHHCSPTKENPFSATHHCLQQALETSQGFSVQKKAAELLWQLSQRGIIFTLGDCSPGRESSVFACLGPEPFNSGPDDGSLEVREASEKVPKKTPSSPGGTRLMCVHKILQESAKHNPSSAAVRSATKHLKTLIQYETLLLAEEKHTCEILYTTKCCQELWCLSTLWWGAWGA